MSEIGLFASGYKRVSEYARVVDRLLLDLKSGISPSEDAVAPVVRLLEGMQRASSAPPAVQLLQLRWQERGKVTDTRLGEILSEIREKKVSARTMEELEQLARLLDQERADMRFRLRGV